MKPSHTFPMHNTLTMLAAATEAVEVFVKSESVDLADSAFPTVRERFLAVLAADDMPVVRSLLIRTVCARSDVAELHAPTARSSVHDFVRSKLAELLAEGDRRVAENYHERQQAEGRLLVHKHASLLISLSLADEWSKLSGVRGDGGRCEQARDATGQGQMLAYTDLELDDAMYRLHEQGLVGVDIHGMDQLTFAGWEAVENLNLLGGIAVSSTIPPTMPAGSPKTEIVAAEVATAAWIGPLDLLDRVKRDHPDIYKLLPDFDGD